jgi:DNA-binding CsgD family transcriptional regulator
MMSTLCNQTPLLGAPVRVTGGGGGKPAEVLLCERIPPLTELGLQALYPGFRFRRCSDNLSTLPAPDQCPARNEGIPVLFMSEEWLETEEASRAAGFQGYLGPSFSLPQLNTAIPALLSGGHYYHPGQIRLRSIGRLTQRQVEVLRLIGKGLTDRQIAHRLNIKVTTVRHHLMTLTQKLDAEGRGELCSIAATGGLIIDLP